MGFRIKHIPSGLYYSKQKGKEINLSAEGNVYDTEDQCYFALKAHGFAPTIALLDSSPNHLALEKLYNFFKYKAMDVYAYANTAAEEWIIETLKEEE